MKRSKYNPEYDDAPSPSTVATLEVVETINIGLKDEKNNTIESIVFCEYEGSSIPAKLSGHPDDRYPDEDCEDSGIEIAYASRNGKEVRAFYGLSESKIIDLMELSKKYADSLWEMDDSDDKKIESFKNSTYYLDEGSSGVELMNNVIKSGSTEPIDRKLASVVTFMSHFTEEELSSTDKLTNGIERLKNTDFKVLREPVGLESSIADVLAKKLDQSTVVEPNSSRKSKLKCNI